MYNYFSEAGSIRFKVTVNNGGLMDSVQASYRGFCLYTDIQSAFIHSFIIYFKKTTNLQFRGDKYSYYPQVSILAS